MKYRAIHPRVFAGLVVWVSIAGWAAAAEPDNDGRRLFETRIQPVLAQRCYKCHSSTAKKLEGGLHLDSSTGLRRGGDSGPVVASGKANDSLILHALRYDGLEMPPDGKLDAEVIADFERWVRMGAPWPGAPTEEAKAAPPQPKTYDFERIQKTHWSLAPIKRPTPPDVAAPEFFQTQIDRFVLAKLNAAGLAPSLPADRRTLARRAYFDLTGLPPTYDELESFAADDAPDAYERLIDRLLASPRYGERWGRHWLDVARYSDTKGQIHQQERGFPYAYTYRDYVIRAFNDDLPFDQFILEQLAADLLPARSDPHKLAALGFLNLRNTKVAAHLQIDDQIDTIGRGLLGMTIACARCHDHKYDAIPTADYYSLYGVLASSEEPQELPLLAEPQATPAYAEFKAKLDKLAKERTDFQNRSLAALLEHARTRVADYLVQIVAASRNAGSDAPYTSLGADDLKPGLINRWREYLRRNARADHPVFGPWYEMTEDRSRVPTGTSAASTSTEPAESHRAGGTYKVNPLVQEALLRAAPQTPADVAKVYGELLTRVYRQSQSSGPQPEGFDELLAVLLADDSPTNVPQRDLTKYLQRDQRDRLEKIQDQVNKLVIYSPAAPPRAMTLVELKTPYEPTVFTRGNPSQPGQPVPRQFLRLLAGEGRQPFREGSGRLELARAIASPDNPLTPRVIVNRVWMHHLGSPLAATPDDFGMRSNTPLHSALLDYLAWRLMDGGWSLKRLHREIMLSGVYRQASADRKDCHQADPENRLYWRMNRQRLELEPMRDSLLAVAGQLDETMHGQPIELMREPFSRRRTVYGRIDRHELAAIYRTFDFPSPYQSAAQRPLTTVPQQMLFMLNSPFVIQQARAVAARKEIVSGKDDDGRIRALYRIVLARQATPLELKAARSFLSDGTARPTSKDKLSAWEQFAQVLLMTNEFLFVD